MRLVRSSGGRLLSLSLVLAISNDLAQTKEECGEGSRAFAPRTEEVGEGTRIDGGVTFSFGVGPDCECDI